MKKSSQGRSSVALRDNALRGEQREERDRVQEVHGESCAWGKILMGGPKTYYWAVTPSRLKAGPCEA